MVYSPIIGCGWMILTRVIQQDHAPHAVTYVHNAPPFNIMYICGVLHGLLLLHEASYLIHITLVRSNKHMCSFCTSKSFSNVLLC